MIRLIVACTSESLYPKSPFDYSLRLSCAGRSPSIWKLICVLRYMIRSESDLNVDQEGRCFFSSVLWFFFLVVNDQLILCSP
jgi:hypothetical protein